MKNPIKSMWITAAMVMAVCVAAQAQQDGQYSTGGGKNIRLAVLEPTGKGLADDDKWMLSLVQGSIYADFIKYSGMNVIDNQNIENIYDEWEKSMSGNYSDADRVKIGNLTNASHILSGTVVKTPNAFMLELAVTDLQSGERKASYSQSVSAAALENHSAIKEASADLLKQLGVNLTGAALGELKQAANIARIQAEEAMARGIVAKRQGTEVAALSYFFQAAALDPSLAEAVNRSSVMAANVSSGNIGADARNDIAWRESWVKRLEETEQYIDHLNKTVSMPYTLYYSDEIIQQGDIDYQNKTVNLTIKTNLHGRNSIRLWARSVEQALQAVYDGLEATGRKRTWKLYWPGNRVTNLKSFDWQGRNFTIVAELVNSRNQVIGSQEFQTGGYWDYDTYERPTLNLGYFHDGWSQRTASGRQDVVFRNVKADGITDKLTIRIASVNGEAAEYAARKGVLQIKAMPKREFDDNNNRFTFAYGEIKDYKVKESGGHLVIPDTIWDDAVISIGKEAFSSKSLTGVTIPNSVTSIGRHAFSYNQLTDITIGENVTLDESAFYNGFEECYKNNGRKAGTYHFYTSSGFWRAVMTSQEIRGKKEMRGILESNESDEAAVGGGEEDIMEKYKRLRREEEVRKRQEKYAKLMEEADPSRTGFQSFYWGGGVLLMLHQYGAPIYIPSFSFLNGQFNAGFTYGFGGADFFKIGMNFDLGPWYITFNPDDAERIKGDIQLQYPDTAGGNIKIVSNGSTKVNFFTRWYLGDHLYLTGGGGWWWHSVKVEENSNRGLDQIPLVSFRGAPVYIVGAGIMADKEGAFFLDMQYNILPYNTGYFDGYLTINIGVTFGGRQRINLSNQTKQT